MDEDTYKKLERDPTTQYEGELKVLVELAYSTGVLSNKEKKYLTPSGSSIPTIYTLPKIHKDIQCPPGRPIGNEIGSIASQMGQFFFIFTEECGANKSVFTGHKEPSTAFTGDRPNRKRRSLPGNR